MVPVYHELLPKIYLIVPIPSWADKSESALAQELNWAQRSGKPAVWVDFSLLSSLSDEAVRLLWIAHHCLQEQRAELVLVHVPAPIKTALLMHESGLLPCMVPTLLDAARRAGWQH